MIPRAPSKRLGAWSELMDDNEQRNASERSEEHLDPTAEFARPVKGPDPADGTILKSYIHANGQILAQHDGDHTGWRYVYLHDRSGSVRQVVNSYGSVMKNYTYEPFGQTIESAGTFYDPFGFTGQYFDAEIGEYYLRARQYNPEIARFTARDPVFGEFEQPLTLHKYLYCGNDSVNRIDPAGLWAFYMTLTSMVSMGKTAIIQEGWVIDHEGNVGTMSLAGTKGVGSPYLFGGLSFGFSPNAENIEAMGGAFYSLGATVPLLAGFGVEAYRSWDTGVYGFEASFGVSSPPGWPEVHAHKTTTRIRKLDMNWKEALAKMEERLEDKWDNMNRVVDLYIWGTVDAMIKYAREGLRGLDIPEKPGR